ncbi:alpha/beta hydrolase family protein [Arenimonas terrae]|jgi:dipeptidyl aminopeptidase/acylaminoacyl peptidase|uniref:S9 family peptidase n=1 Tax=Arenimonas terrae TaxID=2546226 RepID=A0A5C4RRU3_9GAMM|nr:prolyl oligopeptidase family serine peptidase [Arenimonas terrae]TNJ33649.1 S9 family peptidase [Arenimonas terrae]
MRASMMILLALAAGAVPVAATAANPPPIEQFVKHDPITEIELSPTGEYLAFTRRNKDRTALIVVRLSDRTPAGGINHGRDTVITSLTWANDERITYSVAKQVGALSEPRSRGEVFAMNADGSHSEVLLSQLGAQATRAGKRQAGLVFARVVDRFESSPKEVLIQTSPYLYDDASGRKTLPETKLERLNVMDGYRRVVAKAPVSQADFYLDSKDEARFALGMDANGDAKLYYRDGAEAEWKLVNDQAKTSLNVRPIGFAPGDKIAYLQSERDDKPDAIYSYDTATGQRALVAEDDNSDPWMILYSPFDETPFGVVYMDGLPRTQYFDPTSAPAKLHRSLQASFPGLLVTLGRATDDGSKGLFIVRGDRIPGDVYLFDYKAKRADFLMAYNVDIDPTQMAARKPVSLKARDGTPLQGYLTVPNNVDAKNLPLVVLPHGGPMGIYDTWLFDADAQLLASRGYATLQVNYRGSGNHGRDFVVAGYHEWGKAMQDDLTDSTRWAIEQGIADPRRICIYGASYGGYAALMGAVREPDLYRCAVGNVGVYDLAQRYKQDSLDHNITQGLLEMTMGREGLEAVSPNLLADRIRIPVMLAAGEKDETAPPIHTRRMRDALEAAGRPVEATFYKGEGHGYYEPENRMDFYARLLGFLDRHIGAKAAPAAP